MKIPRNMSGEKLATLLGKFGYKITRQAGSHMRLTTALKGEHHITIPKHRPLKVGTINSILIDVSDYLKMSKETLSDELFEQEK